LLDVAPLEKPGTPVLSGYLPCPAGALVAQALSERLTADPEDGSGLLGGDGVVVHQDILPDVSAAASEAGRRFE
jgi:hypothetical protein